MATKQPNNGGCWFCKTDDRNGPHSDSINVDGGMNFSVEFDTNFHMTCLFHAIKTDPQNPEVAIIAGEFNINFNTVN